MAKTLKSWFRDAKSRFFYERLARSRSIRNLVLKAEDAVNINGAAGILYEGDDHAMLVHPHDKTIGVAIRRSGAYQRQELLAAVKAVEAKHGVGTGGTRVFLDIGANIGTHSVYALKSGSFDRGIAVEPEARNLSLLRKNLAINGMADSVTVVPCGASDAVGTARLWINEDNLGAHSIIQPKYGAEHVDIDLRPIDDILTQAGIGFETVRMISIDVEGHEPAAIRGMTRLLEHRPPIMIELNPHGEGFVEMFERLRGLYDSVLVLSGANLKPLARIEGVKPLKDFPTPTEKFDLLFL